MDHIELTNVRAAYDPREDIIRLTSGDDRLFGGLNVVIRRDSAQDRALRELIGVVARPLPLAPLDLSTLGARRVGHADLSWRVGVETTTRRGEVVDSFDSVTPHLLVSGSPGSGKTVLVHNMMLQLASQNGPGELRLWVVEPKTELLPWRNVDIVERFVDSSGPKVQFLRNAIVLLQELAVELKQRHDRLVEAGLHSLDRGRRRAIDEALAGVRPLDANPLYAPYIVVVIEETAALLADSGSKEEVALQMQAFELLGRVMRAPVGLGVAVVLTTQYPTHLTVPSALRGKMRRIGLRCQNSEASEMSIGEAGLERIQSKGAGRLEEQGHYRNFRGYWIDDNEAGGEVSELRRAVEALPRR